MSRKPINYGLVTQEEFVEMVVAYLSEIEISKATGLSKNQVHYRAKKLGICTNAFSTMRERSLIEAGAYFVREEFSNFVGWSLASRSGQFVLRPAYMNAMHKFGFLRHEGSAWRATIDRFGRMVCGPRP